MCSRGIKGTNKSFTNLTPCHELLHGGLTWGSNTSWTKFHPWALSWIYKWDARMGHACFSITFPHFACRFSLENGPRSYRGGSIPTLLVSYIFTTSPASSTLSTKILTQDNVVHSQQKFRFFRGFMRILACFVTHFRKMFCDLQTTSVRLMGNIFHFCTK